MVSSGLAPPTRVREGVVTDSSIELLWDPAQGGAHGYEVMCLDCVHSHMVNLTNQQKKIFNNLSIPVISVHPGDVKEEF